MSTVKTLFSLQISNNYYSDPLNNKDFNIIPTKKTLMFFDRFKLKWFQGDGGLYKLIFYNDSKNFVSYLSNNIPFLEFEIFSTNERFYSFSDLKVGCVYKFDNENEGGRLHKEEFVSDKDIVNLGEYRHRLFGVVKIFLHKIAQVNEFCINIKALASFWTYYISNKNFKIKNLLQIMSSDNNFVFLKHRGSGEDLVYRSEKPISLSDRYDFIVFLEYRRVGSNKTVKEILPSPNTYSNCVADNEYYSDMEYTVI